MKYTHVLALSTVLALGTYTALADDNSTSAESHSAHSSNATAATGSSIRLSKLMDANVQSNTGENLGELEDLLIDPQTGQIKFAVLGRGGFLGLGEKYVPVPWKAIHVQSEKQFTLNVDKNKLKSAPTTDKEYSNLQDPGYTVTVYRFFAVPADDTEMGAAAEPGGTEQGTSSSASGNLNGTKSSSDTVSGDPSNKDDKQ